MMIDKAMISNFEFTKIHNQLKKWKFRANKDYVYK